MNISVISNISHTKYRYYEVHSISIRNLFYFNIYQLKTNTLEKLLVELIQFINFDKLFVFEKRNLKKKPLTVSKNRK